MKKIILPGLIAGIIMLVVGIGLGFLINLIFPVLKEQYNNTNLFRPWNDPLMSIYFLYPFILGLVLAWLWNKIKSVFKEENLIKKGIFFGLTYWIISSIPGMIITYSSFLITLIMVLSWTFSSLVQVLVAGIIVALMNRN